MASAAATTGNCALILGFPTEEEAWTWVNATHLELLTGRVGSAAGQPDAGWASRSIDPDPSGLTRTDPQISALHRVRPHI